MYTTCHLLPSASIPLDYTMPHSVSPQIHNHQTVEGVVRSGKCGSCAGCPCGLLYTNSTWKLHCNSFTTITHPITSPLLWLATQGDYIHTSSLLLATTLPDRRSPGLCLTHLSPSGPKLDLKGWQVTTLVRLYKPPHTLDTWLSVCMCSPSTPF